MALIPDGSVFLLSATDPANLEAIWRFAEASQYRKDKSKLIFEPFITQPTMGYLWFYRLKDSL